MNKQKSQRQDTCQREPVKPCPYLPSILQGQIFQHANAHLKWKSFRVFHPKSSALTLSKLFNQSMPWFPQL